MPKSPLPESIRNLVDNLKLVSFTWQGLPVQVPMFAVYAILDNPVFDCYIQHNGRRMGQLSFGRYRIPVLDPLNGDLESAPSHVVILTHCRTNRFGLYAFPADKIHSSVSLPFYHGSVKRIVKDFV